MAQHDDDSFRKKRRMSLSHPAWQMACSVPKLGDRGGKTGWLNAPSYWASQRRASIPPIRLKLLCQGFLAGCRCFRECEDWSLGPSDSLGRFYWRGGVGVAK